MTGKPLIRNLKKVTETFILSAIPVYTYDRNNTRELPCIVISYETETPSFTCGNHGHFTVNGSISVQYQGYEDIDNTDADNMANSIASMLMTWPVLSGVNRPTSGTDNRPCSGFHMNALFLRSIEREISETSMDINLKFDAFTAARDN